MTQQEILDGNKMIAEFLGWSDKLHQTMSPDISTGFKNEYMRFDSPCGTQSLSYYYKDFTECLPYQSSWSWLRPVVEKIEGIKDDGINWDWCVTIERDFCCITKGGENPLCEYQGHDKIRNVFYAVVQFIKFHNDQK